MLLSCSTFELSSWFKGTISMDAFLELQCMSLLLGMKESSNWAVMSPQIKQTNSGLKPNHFHPVRNSRSSGVAFLLYFQAEQLVQRHYFDGCISRASLHGPSLRHARQPELSCDVSPDQTNKQTREGLKSNYFHQPRNSRSSGVAFLLYFRAEQLVQRHYFDGCISRASLSSPLTSSM